MYVQFTSCVCGAVHHTLALTTWRVKIVDRYPKYKKFFFTVVNSDIESPYDARFHVTSKGYFEWKQNKKNDDWRNNIDS